MINAVSPDEALKIVKDGDHVYIHTAGAAPRQLVEALGRRGPELRGVEIFHMHTEGPAPYIQEGMQEHFHLNSFFVGANVRKATWAGIADFIPCFLSEVPLFFKRGIVQLDVALIQVSPPDQHGYCSLGISVDASKAAMDSAKHVIAQVNDQMPRTHGDSLVHISSFDAFVEHNEPLPDHPPRPIGEVEDAIAEHVAGLVEDRSCLQMGIGAIPDAVLSKLGNHKDLGVHTEMFSEGLIPLVEKGVVTNMYKKKHAGVIVAAFLLGTRKLYDFVDDNPLIRMLSSEYTNDPHVIRQNPKTVSINSAIEVDLTGQVCADSIGTRQYSGVGGQMDFVRGSGLSEGGKPIIALPSTTNKGISRIAGFLKEGAGVVTTRAHVHYIATEYGVVNLYGKNMKERAKALIGIAHPDHQEELEAAAFKRFGASFHALGAAKA